MGGRPRGVHRAEYTSNTSNLQLKPVWPWLHDKWVISLRIMSTRSTCTCYIWTCCITNHSGLLNQIFLLFKSCVCVDIFDGKISQINSMHKIPQNSRWSTLTSHIHDALYYCVFFSAKRRTFLWHACECINTHLVGVFLLYKGSTPHENKQQTHVQPLSSLNFINLHFFFNPPSSLFASSFWN